MFKLITAHSTKILNANNNNNNNNNTGFNCHVENNCLLNGACLMNNIVYRASIDYDKEGKKSIFV